MKKFYTYHTDVTSLTNVINNEYGELMQQNMHTIKTESLIKKVRD